MQNRLSNSFRNEQDAKGIKRLKRKEDREKRGRVKSEMRKREGRKRNTLRGIQERR